MTSLTEFLLARIAEDEAVARQATQAARPGVSWIWINVETDEPARLDGELENVSLRTREEFPTTSGVGPLPAFIVDNAESYAERAGALRHIARNDPARVLAECEAKRRIVEEHPEHNEWGHKCSETPCTTLQLLALPYAAHPDYLPEWRPDPVSAEERQ